eukprot:7445837-Pyramimonas_sp.AAC.1
MQLELQMSYRDAWHSKRKKIIRSARFEYLDARTRSATTAGADHEFMDAPRAVGATELFGTAIERKSSTALVSSI